jgi:hypothetical protein
VVPVPLRVQLSVFSHYSTYAAAYCGALLSSACIDAGQEHVTIRLRAAGTDATEPRVTVTGWQVELERAELAFGPFYLCAGYQAGALCETARAEWVDSAVVNALNPTPRSLGELSGSTGLVRSWMYDLGLASLLTRDEPVVLAAAKELGDNSVRIEGTARKGQHMLAFGFAAPISQSSATEPGVPVVQHRSSDHFEHKVSLRDEGLTIRFDPWAWLVDVDFDRLQSLDLCVPENTALECIDADGRVRFSESAQGHRAIRSAVLAGQRPTFEWR